MNVSQTRVHTALRTSVFAFALGLASPGCIILGGTLQTGGSSSNYGRGSLAQGDSPISVTATSGGTVAASAAGSGCRGSVTSQPDYIVTLTTTVNTLRVAFVAASNADTTLVVARPTGGFECNDDGGSGLNPLINISSAPAGQYDIWVGSFNSSQRILGTLTISAL